MKDHSESIYFLHGLESSGNGTKGRYFSEKFPKMKRPDFSGSLEERLSQLDEMCQGEGDLIFVGSSYGGLMGTCFANKQQARVKKLILLAPALNFEDYSPPAEKLTLPTLLIIGKHDDVTPMDPVLKLARQSFAHLTVWICDDDHMLHKSFYSLDWQEILQPDAKFPPQPPPGFETS